MRLSDEDASLWLTELHLENEYGDLLTEWAHEPSHLCLGSVAARMSVYFGITGDDPGLVGWALCSGGRLIGPIYWCPFCGEELR